MKTKCRLLWFLFFILVFSCKQKSATQKIQILGEAQGTYYSIAYFDENQKNYQQEIDSILAKIDQSVSLWVPHSVLSQINDGKSPPLDDIFIENFLFSQQVYKQSDGFFDPTVGLLVEKYGFHFKQKVDFPEDSLHFFLDDIGLKYFALRDSLLIKQKPNVHLDFNAIAQGYSVDKIGAFLQSKGIQNFIIDIGGEVLAKGKKPDGNWVVGIEKPSYENKDRELKAKLKVQDKAIATSGSYRKFYEKNGVKYSHTINPKTGLPVTHSLLSVTVMADKCVLADAWATAFMVMGQEKAKNILQTHPEMQAYFIFSKPDGSLGTWQSEGLKKKLVD